MGKTLHLIRHGEAYHNVQGEILCQVLDFKSVLIQGRWRRLTMNHLVRILSCICRLLCGFIWRLLCSCGFLPAAAKSPAFTPYEHLDSSLTATGWQQVTQLAKHIRRADIELVVVSPFARTLQTASGVFGGGAYADEEERPPLMTDKVGRCSFPAISSLGAPPLVAMELCREVISNFPCDRRRSTSKAMAEFPGVDFSQVEEEEDSLWQPNTCETPQQLSARIRAFLEWLWVRPEKEIAVVSHGGFLFEMLSQYGDATITPARFNNCDLRTVIMDNKGAGFVIKYKDRSECAAQT